MSKTVLFVIGGLVFAGIIFQVLGRVPSDTLNVALGVLCGVAAGIPVSIGLLLALTRQRERPMEQPEWSDLTPEPVQVVPQPIQRIPQYAQATENTPAPQIILVAAPQGQFGAGQFPQGFPAPSQWLNQAQYPSMQEQVNAVDAREWRIIGEDQV